MFTIANSDISRWVFNSLDASLTNFFPMLISALVNSNSGAKRGALQTHSKSAELIDLATSWTFSLFSEWLFFWSCKNVVSNLICWFLKWTSKQLQLLSKALPLIKSPIVNFKLVMLGQRLMPRNELFIIMPVVSLRARLWVALKCPLELAWLLPDVLELEWFIDAGMLNWWLLLL